MSDPNSKPETPNADLEWDERGQPISAQFGDVYFSKDDGLAETRHVFIANNQLPERFAALGARQQFVIGETGFGTGLNFLCAWQLFEQLAPAGARLHFISVEKYPLTRSDLERALQLWPELAVFSAQLLAQYRAIHPGFQRLTFANGRIVLTLLVGDVLEQLPQLDAQVDAWFLDGFAPAKNPQMWVPELYSQLARLSAPGTTLGTFTSVGYVRRGLIDVGFAMERTPGFGRKREVLKGVFNACSLNTEKPWFARPQTPAGKRHALVIGAGMAGCATASSLAQRGWQVTILERHAAIAQEASGNPQGVLYLKLSAHHTTLSRLIVSGFGYTRRLIQQLTKGEEWDDCGVLQLAFDEKEAKRQAQLAEAFPPDLLHVLDQSQAQMLAGVPLNGGGLFYPDAGWVHPPALCQLLSEQPNIRLQLHQEVLELRRQDGQWQAWDQEQLLASADVAVLANAAQIRQFSQSAELPLKRIRGQITRVPVTDSSQALKTVLCAEGYVAPPRNGEHTLGASFDFHSDEVSLKPAEHVSNLDLLRDISGELAQRMQADQLDPNTLQGRAAFRCTSPDYLPIVGPLADAEHFAKTYAALSKNARKVPNNACPWLEGLYINSGHGSRGLITAPLSGELIAAWLDNEPMPVPADVAHACHPNRFALRALMRKQN
ncbi:bifunctional tRNA (5-methylaminomethyl-2-thiouridine)(34)-methyltransferase MnmD/FAD-dependent 5-carboxymethylaminomethyl-2-thiouridine(34) oxidoreductase MnmC [Pseudomonas sp. TTU2014-080ASC]|uniref:bifunctional tRNA (5-methylaminomethyl-2-thiouridine)(34)-methyltransferase MnmD/FAD-dependent 5-carboxymethylaminomethyl-2-thiouridine(34) oxidoreductase MnmC n=1 Tax=Pseudomonas sp. TTU2014-080ASC TaxID=1729724 RepID=UPI0007183B35|nr:bifunctional tRNA (5-methylaminomethyl-2-thiouridine)(34)-methyltransferase MnmD/FAD-dependent 5-carboxymethylaminomethyl-2-thiouridine(34) oxidoreductase MnmC [Pseudomonas sp. TTU2014-080ASC]KRW57969.1 FAD-dependent cmnm(5)s(2)U34 oxidoreductase [Pseudomonas sp. TTU2014-080ASC]